MPQDQRSASTEWFCYPRKRRFFDYSDTLLDHIPQHGRDLYRATCDRDLEGIVAKWAAGTYQTDGRRTSWLKVKNPECSQMIRRRMLFDARRDRSVRQGLLIRFGRGERIRTSDPSVPNRATVWNKRSVNKCARSEEHLTARTRTTARRVGARPECAHGVPTVCPKSKWLELPQAICAYKNGRDDWIRTSGPLTPSQVRYQAAPHPEIL